jgi:hypothetical protein
MNDHKMLWRLSYQEPTYTASLIWLKLARRDVLIDTPEFNASWYRNADIRMRRN